MSNTDRLQAAEILGMLHGLPVKQQERILYVMSGLRMMSIVEKEEEKNHNGNETEC